MTSTVVSILFPAVLADDFDSQLSFVDDLQFILATAKIDLQQLDPIKADERAVDRDRHGIAKGRIKKDRKIVVYLFQ